MMLDACSCFFGLGTPGIQNCQIVPLPPRIAVFTTVAVEPAICNCAMFPETPEASARYLPSHIMEPMLTLPFTVIVVTDEAPLRTSYKTNDPLGSGMPSQ